VLPSWRGKCGKETLGGILGAFFLGGLALMAEAGISGVLGATMVGFVIGFLSVNAFKRR
jgi:hypothetical protein